MVVLEVAEIDPDERLVRLKSYEDLVWLADRYDAPIFHDDRGPKECLEEWVVYCKGFTAWYGKA